LNNGDWSRDRELIAKHTLDGDIHDHHFQDCVIVLQPP
jgi:hypothetical protein